jgi:hypothetical protein
MLETRVIIVIGIAELFRNYGNVDLQEGERERRDEEEIMTKIKLLSALTFSCAPLPRKHTSTNQGSAHLREELIRRKAQPVQRRKRRGLR